ncbi:hypothetical protein GGR51DRAFT_523337 [Nemania sp. FL0031]|nr:hypothetical protein GGR51DRAFT_523337 [Nemania sp. FL0031]
MVQWDASIGTVSNEVNSDPDLTRKDAMKDPLRSSDSDNDVAISSPDSPGCGSGIPIPLPDAPLDIGSDAVTPSQFNRTSSVSCVPSTTTSPFPPTMTASRPLPNLRSRKRLTRELSLLRTPKVPLSLPSVPKSPSRFVSVPELGSKLVSPLSVQQQIPTLVSPAASTLGDGKSQTTLDDPQGIRTRRGWYQVRGIINEAPGGLYLVEWEGRDPRTGVKVSCTLAIYRCKRKYLPVLISLTL